MSGIGPGGSGSNPFEGIFGELARLLGSSTGEAINWDVARQVAVLIAGEGQSEGNVDPIDRMRLEEMVRIAEMHVNQVPGLSLIVRGVQTVSHIEWANKALDAYKELLTKMSESLGRKSSVTDDIEPGANPFGDIEKWMSPVLLGMQAGGMVGHLARRCLGQFDLPIPRTPVDTIVLVPANIAEFSESWTLPIDELSLYIAVEEVTRAAVFEKQHVRDRFSELIGEYVSGFEPDERMLEERFGMLSMDDPSQIGDAIGDPEALLGAIQTPAQRTTLVHLHALVAVFLGYVDHVAGKIGERTIASGNIIDEAAKRRRVEENSAGNLVDKLFGLELSQAQFDRGNAFIAGVIERNDGDDAILERLWRSPRELPTPAEVDAPGLWLERIDLPE